MMNWSQLTKRTTSRPIVLVTIVEKKSKPHPMNTLCPPLNLAYRSGFYVFVAGLLLCGYVSTGCDSSGNQLISKHDSKDSTNTLTVNVMRITRELNAIETATFFGTLKPNRQSELGFGKGGRIESIFKQVGEAAIEGEKLAALDQSQLEKQKSDIEEKLLRSRQALQSVGSDRVVSQQEVQGLEAQLDAVTLELANGFIFAPFDCVVARQFVDASSEVSPRRPVLQIFENTSPLVETNLPRRIADQLTVDQILWVSIGEQAVQAQVKTRSPIETSVGSQAISLQITTDLTQNSWAVGQSVKIRFFVSTKNSGYWLPISALSREPSGLWSAFLIADGTDEQVAGLDDEVSKGNGTTVVRKMLEIVQLEDDWALAQGALEDGQRVIVNGTHRVVPGQRVKTTDITAQFYKPGSGASE